MQGYGLVGEDGEADLPFVADKLDAVGACAVVRDEAPRAAARQPVGKLEGGANAVLCLVEPAAIGAETVGTHNRAEEFLQEVYLMRGKVVEVAAASNVALHTPRERGGIVVEVAWRTGKPDLHADDVAYGAALEQLLNLKEIGQVAAIVCHEAGDVCLLAHAVDTLAVVVAAGKGFLDVDGLAALHGHNGIGGMR